MFPIILLNSLMEDVCHLSIKFSVELLYVFTATMYFLKPPLPEATSSFPQHYAYVYIEKCSD